MIDRQTLVASGAPPEVVDLLIDAQQAAQAGDMEPMRRALQMLDELSTMSQQGPETPTLCYPLSNPEAAEALFAFSSDDGMDPGYAVAAKRALQLDSDSVDALVTLGDLAESSTERVFYYRRACQSAKVKPPEAVAREMPALRSRMGMRLVDDARLVDAVQVMLPGLEEDPSDAVGMRFPLVDLTLRLGWHDELQTILDRYADNDEAPIQYARALFAFQIGGASRRADALLVAAHERHPSVAPFLAAIEPMPVHSMQHCRVGSREEAAMVASYLLPSVRCIEGATRWIRDTLDLASDGNPERTAARSIDSDDDPECDDAMFDDDAWAMGLAAGDHLGFALSLPDGTQTWQYVLHRAKDGSYHGAILEQGELIGYAAFTERPKTQQLRQFVLATVAEPITGRPRKPAAICVPTKADLTALRKGVGTYGVECRHHRVSSEQKAFVSQAVELLIANRSAKTGGPDADSAIDITSLPTSPQPWLMGVFAPPLWIHDRATPTRPYLQVVVDSETGMILGSELSQQQLTPQQQVDSLLAIMQRPAVGIPRQPPRVLLDPDTPITDWADTGLDIEIVPGSVELKEYFDDLISDLLGRRSAVDGSLLTEPEVTKEFLEGFYVTAARFYRAAPWRMVGGDRLMKLTFPEEPATSWGVSVIGQLGQTLGLSLMRDIEAARAFIEQDEDPRAIETLDTISVQFGEAFDMLPRDLWNLERNHWEVAGDEGYPLVVKMEAGGRPVCPSHEELMMTQAVMRSLPSFLDRPGHGAIPIQDASGRTMRLGWEIR